MSRHDSNRRSFLKLFASSLACGTAAVCLADENAKPRTDLVEPVFRISRKESDEHKLAQQHPLDPAIELAKDCLKLIHENIVDYSCTIVKQERINDVLNEPEHMYAEVRNRKVDARGNVTTNFGVYLYFLKPTEIKGREVMFVEGQNNNHLVAHEARPPRSLLGHVSLSPTGVIAMQGQRYPITDIGLENLVVKLIERGERDRKLDPQAKNTEVRFIDNAKINDRVCQVLEVKHPEQKEIHDFHIARVFVDQETKIPVRYAAYLWPATPNGQPEVIECYTYINIKTNVGLKDDDFDHKKKFRS